ncbi:MAG: aldose 1-epimerase, partial [Solirubrobacterales bacterium]|nr:aldose 1-epimerase [Solirubrobacterales bacterium]
QRQGLRAYAAERVTMGIPLLYPWANRLTPRRFEVAGREVVLESLSPPLRTDSDGLPMHGLLAGAAWDVRRHEATDDGALLEASFDFGAHDELMAAFPFAHEILYEARLGGPTLTISITVRGAGDGPVPISFGFHPYLRLPDVDRSDWEVEIPVAERLLLDERLLPTGEREPVRVAGGRLGSRTFDDAYTAPGGSTPFVLAGGGRRIELSFREGYRFAQVYAPADDPVIAFEPMTAPTNALVSGGTNLPLLAAGDNYRATFSITVAEAGG